MEKLPLTNITSYQDKLIYMAFCCLQCTLTEMGLNPGKTEAEAVLPREEIEKIFKETFTAGTQQLQNGHFLPLEYLFGIFDCDAFERHAVLMTLFTQVSPEAASLLALLHNDKNMGFSTPLALSRTYAKQGNFVEYAAYFAKGAKLLKRFFAEDIVNIYSRLTLSQPILEFILGSRAKESYYAPLATLWTPEAVDEQLFFDEEPAEQLLAYIQKNAASDLPVVFNLFGEKGAGRKNCIKCIGRESGLNLMFIELLYLLHEQEPLLLLDKIISECLIFQAIPVISGLCQDMPPSKESLIPQFFTAILESFAYSFVITEHQMTAEHLEEGVLLISMELGRLSLENSVRLWELESAKYTVDKKVSFYELAGEFTLTAGRIRAAFKAAQAIAEMYGNGIIGIAELKRGCYNSLHFTMGSKALRLDTVYTWDDLVLPPYQKNLLLTACNQVRYKYTVYQKWGFQDKMAYGKNVSMLFTGPPGTGKTMAAQVVSHELGLDIYKIELATVISKYVGETEKNLNEIFQQAQKSQVILFFDEADVLFSKRTEVKDSNDKYSNMEAAFLLQKMEEYDGVSILATNYIQNFDEAFKRRIKFVIDFPFPDQAQRHQIWQKVFPPQLPLGELDYDYLTARFELSGSNIKNIALHSAFLAAADGSVRVEMKHIIAAIRNEYAKSGKMLTKEDLGEYYILLAGTQGDG